MTGYFKHAFTFHTISSQRFYIQKCGLEVGTEKAHFISLP